MADDTIAESLAARIFSQAISEGRASDLMEALWAGGSATVDRATGGLVIAPVEALAQILGGSDDLSGA